MKIGILTLPLSNNNYGGLLQAYALQYILRSLGHEVLTVDLSKRRTLYRRTRILIIKAIRKYILRQKGIGNVFIGPGKNELSIINQNFIKFIQENIRLTECIPVVEKIEKLKKYNFEAIVVGSDQVWRKKYSPGIPTYFLDFLKNDRNVKRIAYAASFGTEIWEFKKALTAKCERLIKKFDAISVREDSAVKLCQKYLGVSALHLLDPTLLLDKNEYFSLIKKEKIPEQKNTLLCYILDNSPNKHAISEEVRNRLSLRKNSIMPEQFSRGKKSTISDCVYPPVSQWIRGFIDAEFVVTDSYHGTIFSILFNKPFISIANEKRGIARFSSLLKTFELENRLITSGEFIDYDSLLNCTINYAEIEQLIKQEKEKALKFLTENL